MNEVLATVIQEVNDIVKMGQAITKGQMVLADM